MLIERGKVHFPYNQGSAITDGRNMRICRETVRKSIRNVLNDIYIYFYQIKETVMRASARFG
ncbi:protein of unknown function [Cupriavidus taiwanensis]|nr:protein of unknown function [Cupriavidus taiwanensis]